MGVLSVLNCCASLHERVMGWVRLWLLLVVLFPLCLTAQGTGPLRVGVDADYPPFEWVDSAGQPQGYTVALLRAVAQSQHLEVEFHPMVWRDLRGAFDRGEIDVLTGMAASERRMETCSFTVPHSTLLYCILTRIKDSRIRSEGDLGGMEIWAEEGDVIYEYLLAKGLKVRGVKSPRDAIQGLAEGGGDCAVVPKLMWLHLQQREESPRLRLVPSEVFPTKFCFAVRKGRDGLLAQLNEGLFKAQQDGSMRALHNRFLGSLEVADLSLLVILRRAMPSVLAGVFALGLLVVAGWSLALRQAVKRQTAALQATIVELEGALAEVKQLSGLIPMCAGCKKVRDDSGYWEAVEAYLGRHLEAQFTHGLCPDCVKIYFPAFPRAAGGDASAPKDSV